MKEEQFSILEEKIDSCALAGIELTKSIQLLSTDFKNLCKVIHDLGMVVERLV